MGQNVHFTCLNILKLFNQWCCVICTACLFVHSVSQMSILTSSTCFCQQAGNTAEEFLLYTVTLGIPSGLKQEKSQFPWWMVIVFYQVLWGFILPIAGSYLAEAHSRTVFVNAIQWEWHEEQAEQYFKDSICGMVFVILIIVQLLWFSLREWEWHQAS